MRKIKSGVYMFANSQLYLVRFNKDDFDLDMPENLLELFYLNSELFFKYSIYLGKL